MNEKNKQINDWIRGKTETIEEPKPEPIAQANAGNGTQNPPAKTITMSEYIRIIAGR